MAAVETWPATAADIRSLLARHLRGDGVELGPGDNPFPLPYSGVNRQFVDKFLPADNRELFPELGAGAVFPEPDILCDFDLDRLDPIGDDSQDFVIASHVIEHVAEPLGFLDAIHRIVRPGGTLILLVPDRHRTFDHLRQPTPLAHLVDEHERGVTEVDDEHLLEYMHEVRKATDRSPAVPTDPVKLRAMLDWLRTRSIHAHCWDEREFTEVLLHVMRAHGHRWELVDGVVSEDEGDEGHEFGYVLRKAEEGADPQLLADRLDAGWARWSATRRRLLEQLANERRRVAELDAAVQEETRHRDDERRRREEAEAGVRAYEERLERFRSLPVYPLYRRARGLASRLRR